MGKISEFLSEIFQFSEVKFSTYIYLNRRVFVMFRSPLPCFVIVFVIICDLL